MAEQRCPYQNLCIDPVDTIPRLKTCQLVNSFTQKSGDLGTIITLPSKALYSSDWGLVLIMAS